jgi:hypothetical protein
MLALGHYLTSCAVRPMSALAPNAAAGVDRRCVRFRPKADIGNLSRQVCRILAATHRYPWFGASRSPGLHG